jgi:hypothetical protein
MLWILPGVFALFGLPFALFPRFMVEHYSHRSPSYSAERKAQMASSIRAMGVLFLLTAAVFVVLILTGVLR